MADDEKPESIFDTVRAAAEEVESGQTEPRIEREAPTLEPAAPLEGETAQQAADRVRDEQGRFAKGPKEPRSTLKLKPEKPAVAAGTPAAQPLTAAPATDAAGVNLAPEIDKEGKHLERIPPPQAWGGLAKTKWDQLPRAVREEISAREAQRETATADMLPLKQMFDENRDFLIAKSGSVQNAMGQMMQFARMAETVDGARNLAQHILRAQGLDPLTAFSGQPQQAPGGQQQQDPQALLAQLVRQEMQPFVGHIQAQQTQQLDNVKSQIAAYSSSPDAPYFNDVAADIQFLLESGRVPQGDPMTRLKTAYDMAVHMNPTIRASLTSAAQEAEAAKRAEDARKARAATVVSLRGSPIPGGTTKGAGSNQSVHDAVRQAMEEAGA